MNTDQIAGNWLQLRGRIKEQWGKLTDDDLEIVNGQYERLVGRIQARYGMTRELAEHAVREWLVGVNV
jgi:uncharacterized protein YjbJ (UPF0337 family)